MRLGGLDRCRVWVLNCYRHKTNKHFSVQPAAEPGFALVVPPHHEAVQRNSHRFRCEPTPDKPRYQVRTFIVPTNAASQPVRGSDVSCGSWPCENAGALRTRRTIFLSRTMFARPVARRLGTRSASRTRFPSVDVVSEFSHGQGHLQPESDG